MPKPGDYTLTTWREDQAGNQSKELASDPVRLRFDPDPPNLAFRPQDPGDPLRVEVGANDPVSGVAGGGVEIRREDGKTWHELQTKLDDDGDLVAYVDDQRFGDGDYKLRAHAVDRAGNERSTDKQASGARAGLTLPVRARTRMFVGVRRVKVRRLRVRGKRVRRKIVRLVPAARATIGRTVRIRGVLVNRDGQPVDGAEIEVLGRDRYEDEGFGTLGFVRTNLAGRFSYRAKANRSRVLRFEYRGGRRIGAASDQFDLRVPATSTIGVSDSRVFNGDTVTFSGRLRGGGTPNEGKLLEIQSFFRGRWRTFSTVRSDAQGRWSFSYQFGGTSGLITYPFRVRIPHEGGYPFDTGRSRVVRVAVRGP